MEGQCETVTPQQLVDKALSLVPYGNIGIAFTYNEPLIGYEFVRDSARLAKENGLKTVLVTSGNASEKVLDELLPYIDAYNIDLKGFTDDYYRYVGGNLDMTKCFIEKAAKAAHVELTTLIVPGKTIPLRIWNAWPNGSLRFRRISFCISVGISPLSRKRRPYADRNLEKTAEYCEEISENGRSRQRLTR
nr:radical SAM protein [Allobaculum sp. Allo2]